MMRVAVISDIHGNHYALEKVLLSAKENKVDKLLVLGDIVGYYYSPSKVLSMLSEWDYDLIRGNHEVLLQQVLSGKIEISYLTQKYGSGHQIALDTLSTSELDTLTSAPDKKEIVVDGIKMLMCHGSNWDPNQYLYPDTDTKILGRSTEADVDFVFVGHSHYPFVFENKNNTLINVGSVGQSRKQGGISNWVILDVNDKSFTLQDTSYDVEPLIRDIQKINPEMDYLTEVLTRNNDRK